MKKFFGAAAVVLAIIIGIYFFQKAGPSGGPNPGSTNSAAVASSPNPPSAGSSSINSQAPTNGLSPASSQNPEGGDNLAARAGAVQSIVADTNAVALPPSAILETMRLTIRSYNTQFGENPVGNNAEITAALMGKNPRHLNFIQPDSGLHVNGDGELVDAWGTPFFFHQLSGQVMEIHSAGPDRIMWTSDDSVTR